MVYGHEVKSDNDEFLQLAEYCVWLLSNKIASSGGIWPVDVFPLLKHIPSWFPGMAFKRNAVKWKTSMQEFIDKPFEYVQESLVRNSYDICATSTHKTPFPRKLALRSRAYVALCLTARNQKKKYPI